MYWLRVTEHVQAAPQAVTHVGTFNFADRLTDDNRRDLVLCAELWQNDRRVALQVATFVPTKHLALADPAVAAILRNDGGQLIVELTARSLARLVELSLDGADVIFSDNYFDLPAQTYHDDLVPTAGLAGRWSRRAQR